MWFCGLNGYPKPAITNSTNLPERAGMSSLSQSRSHEPTGDKGMVLQALPVGCKIMQHYKLMIIEIHWHIYA